MVSIIDVESLAAKEFDEVLSQLNEINKAASESIMPTLVIVQVSTESIAPTLVIVQINIHLLNTERRHFFDFISKHFLLYLDSTFYFRMQHLKKVPRSIIKIILLKAWRK